MKSSRQQTAGDVIVIPRVSVIDRRPQPLKLTWHRVTFTILHAVAAERLVTVSWDDSRWIRRATEAGWAGGQLVFAVPHHVSVEYQAQLMLSRFLAKTGRRLSQFSTTASFLVTRFGRHGSVLRQ